MGLSCLPGLKNRSIDLYRGQCIVNTENYSSINRYFYKVEEVPGILDITHLLSSVLKKDSMKLEQMHRMATMKFHKIEYLRQRKSF